MLPSRMTVRPSLPTLRLRPLPTWVLLCWFALPFPAAAQPACPAIDGPASVVACALQASLVLATYEQEHIAHQGHALQARTLLPSQPVLQLSMAMRTPLSPLPGADPSTTLNYYLALSQEIELAGQRSARMRGIHAMIGEHEERHVFAAEQIALTALITYYNLLAVREAQGLLAQIQGIADKLAQLGKARQDLSLSSALDAHLAQVEAVRLATLRLAADRRHSELGHSLASQLGLADLPPVEGSLDALMGEPLTGDPGEVGRLVDLALSRRADLLAARHERDAKEARTSLLVRQHVPNLTLSFLAQRDGFSELVLGGGISLPLPLPAPVGPSPRGELQAARAHLAEADVSIARVQRQIRLEVTTAIAHEQNDAAQANLYAPEQTRQAQADLLALSQALLAQALSPRDALGAERALLEFLVARIEARRALAVSRIERLAAVGQPLAHTHRSHSP